MGKHRVSYGGLVGHTDVNQDEREADDATLLNMIYESASQVASATKPVVPGSVAHGIWGWQLETLAARYDEIRAECERRGVRVYRPEDTSAHADFRRRA